jgi:lipopolysaccharide biosynthesis regulator YciM
MAAWGGLAAVQPAAFNLVAREYATCAMAANDREGALERLESIYRRAPTLDILEAMAMLEPSDEGRRSRLLAHLRLHPTLSAARAVLDDRAPPELEAAETSALRQAIERAARPLHRYRCAACGFEAEHYFWQCPGCLGWDTYPPQRLEDL